jgi:hypothetical protein
MLHAARRMLHAAYWLSTAHCRVHTACCMLHVACVCCMLYALHSLAQPCTALHSLAQPCTALHSLAQPCTALHTRDWPSGSKNKFHFLFGAELSISNVCIFRFSRMNILRNQILKISISQSSHNKTYIIIVQDTNLWCNLWSMIYLTRRQVQNIETLKHWMIEWLNDWMIEWLNDWIERIMQCNSRTETKRLKEQA